MTTYQDLWAYYEEHDRVLFMSLRTTHKMSNGEVELFAPDILAFLDHRKTKNPFETYKKRNDQLNKLQLKFEKTQQYDAQSYKDVPELDHEAYNISLLLSFLIANHRFEILQQLMEFIKRPCEQATVLSIGAGTGYELKLVRDILPTAHIDAFEISQEAIDYATDFLSFHGVSNDCLHLEKFPLEQDEGLAAHKEKYKKIIMCEVLEHLEDPLHALKNLKQCLHKDGEMFLTMAINIAQEDHVFHYTSVEQARQQVLDAGLTIVSECSTPVAMLPFEDRSDVKRGNYVCVVKK